MIEQAKAATEEHWFSLADSYGEALANQDGETAARVADAMREAQDFINLLHEAQEATFH